MTRSGLLLGLLVVASLFAAEVFTEVLLSSRPSSQLWDWFITLVATLISATLAVVGGIYLFTYQSQKTEEQRREQIGAALAAELRSNVLALQARPNTPLRDVNTGDLIGNARIFPLGSLAVEEAIRSGLLPPGDTLLLNYVRWRVELHNVQISQLLLVMSGKPKREMVTVILEDLLDRQEKLRTLCQQLLSELEAAGIDVPPDPRNSEGSSQS
jgi:hypothetical protein